MNRLRFLKFFIPPGKNHLASVYLPKSIMPFHDNLTYLEWDGYPLTSLPQPFYAEQLIEIRLQNSNVEHLWHGIQVCVFLPLRGVKMNGCLKDQFK
jgi:hypothetical protein